jgi:hypothetical protein
LAGGMGTPSPAAGQETPAAAAAREEAEANYRRLSAELKQLTENYEFLQKQMAELSKSVRELSDQVARNAQHPAGQDKLQQLAAQVQKVDEARVADNKKIFDTIAELHGVLKNLAANAGRRPPPPPPTTNGGSTNVSTEGFEYEVKEHDTLSGIVQAYRLNNIKVSAKAIMEANPNVKWNALKIGQKIWIPKPKS